MLGHFILINGGNALFSSQGDTVGNRQKTLILRCIIFILLKLQCLNIKLANTNVEKSPGMILNFGLALLLKKRGLCMYWYPP